MAVTDKQVRKLMMEYQKTGKVGIASLRAGITRKTGRKYLGAGKVPSQMKVEHTWQTRHDPFKEHWEEAKTMLEGAPELQAKALFEWLCERHPTTYHEGQLRTFQRRVRAWRALEGPDKEVFFQQEHTPGRVLQTDFTWMTELKITINREPFPHQVCHSVLPYSEIPVKFRGQHTELTEK